MGTEVLRPQDCLVERIRSSPSCSVFVPRRKTNNHHYYQGDAFNYNFAPKITRKQPVVHQRKPNPTRRFDPTLSRRSSSVDDLKLSRNGRGDDHLTAKKAVLRRVESLEKISTTGKPDVLYAGSAFAVSPSPSSLPLPSFSKTSKNSCVNVDDSATRDLRRLLRIDM